MTYDSLIDFSDSTSEAEEKSENGETGIGNNKDQQPNPQLGRQHSLNEKSKVKQKQQ